MIENSVEIHARLNRNAMDNARMMIIYYDVLTCEYENANEKSVTIILIEYGWSTHTHDFERYVNIY